MPQNDFPSGPWTGYYQYPDGQRGHQDLQLHFADGRISGTGADEVGQFIVEGNYHGESKEAQWMKCYPSGHRVEYRGFREGPVPGIWGTWHIPGNWSGGFHIWPLGGDAHTESEIEVRQTFVIKVPAEAAPAGA